jgi:hypothetical protein
MNHFNYPKIGDYLQLSLSKTFPGHSRLRFAAGLVLIDAALFPNQSGSFLAGPYFYGAVLFVYSGH